MRRAGIVGAGIGGLASALALARNGWQVELFERAEKLSEIGAGLQLGPNATRILDHWGLLHEIRERAFEPTALLARDWRSGQTLNRSALGYHARTRWGSPYLQCHRADLQAVLLNAIKQQDGIQLHLGQAVRSLQDDTASLQTASGEQATFDLLIGADGVKSTLRQLLFDTGPPRYTGQCAWRLMLPASTAPSLPPAACLWLGPGRHLVHYYVRGGEWLNCVGVVENANWSGNSWTEPADFEALQADFAGAHGDILALVEAARGQPCYRWALHELPTLPRWSRGRVTLLGDACHAMLPFLAQGAAMAIEDAAVLANCLERQSDVSRALRDYEQLRGPRATWVQRASRRNARIFHLRGLPATTRNLAMRTGLAGPGRLTETLYSYDALSAG